MLSFLTDHGSQSLRKTFEVGQPAMYLSVKNIRHGEGFGKEVIFVRSCQRIMVRYDIAGRSEYPSPPWKKQQYYRADFGQFYNKWVNFDEKKGG